MIGKGHQCRVALHHASKYGIKQDYEYQGVYCMVGSAISKVDTYRVPDIILTHLDMTQYSIIMSKETRKPLVHFVHNDIPYPSIMQSNENTFIVFNSNWIRLKIGYKQPGYVLHPPCDYRVYDTGDPSEREYITLVSLNERKGGMMFYNIVKAMPDKKFLGVIGSYDNPGVLGLSQVDIINKLLQLPNFTLVPNTPNILDTYRKTRLLLMPSDYESWGRTATEAMCSGIPVVCTPTPGLLENCDYAGYFIGREIKPERPGGACVDIGDSSEWIEAIRQFDDPEFYSKKSLLCKQRSRELDPLKELEGLEQFLINVKSGHFSR
jgi:glycosyltransferase involved in cell wall biosynthesis